MELNFYGYSHFRSRVLIGLLFLISGSVFAQLWLVDPLEAIYPDINNLGNYNKEWKADFPKGTNAEVHVLVKVPLGKTITIAASQNGKELINVWSQLADVPVEQNTGLDSRTEQFTNQTNPHVIRRAPFRLFEVIQPFEEQEITSTTNYTAFRLSIPSSNIKENGLHKIKIKVTSDGLSEDGIFFIKIYPVELPKPSESKFFYTNWFNLSKMEEYHDLERWSETWFQMLDIYASMMAHGRQNAITIPHELIQWKDDKFVLEEDKLLRYIDVFKKYGFKYFESPHLMNRGDNDDWGDPELKVSLTGKRYYKENGKNDIEELMTLIHKFVLNNDLKNNWLQHIADEPTAVNANCYKDVADQVKRIFPQIKIMEATNDRDGIAGSIDIWCPLINDFQENESFFREREKQGEQILVYTCLIPGGKWLNRTLDMEKLRQVYFGWGAAFYNTNGYLHWGLNQYMEDPFKQSVIKHPSPMAGSNNYLPAGDTHIIYPGKEGPLSSIRFESQRLGIEDYDLLQRLKEKNKNKYNKLINKLFRSYTDYNLNLKDYRRTKMKLLKALK